MNDLTTSCKICNSNSNYLFDAQILSKYVINYYKCQSCGFVQTENPYWLGEAYSSSINLVDTGLTRRNVLASKSVSTILFFCFDKKAKYLDYAAGYGMFTRLMRDVGFDFYTHDPYTPNLLARGFDYNPQDIIELLTTFESFEHFVEPLVEIEKMLAISRNIFFSTHLIPSPTPPIDKWWYYGTEHGQHVAFYTPKALNYIANKYGLQVYTLKGYHLLTEKKIGNLIFNFLVGSGRFGLNNFVNLFMKTKVKDDMTKLRKLSK